MTARDQWNAKQMIPRMIEELKAMPPHDGLQVTINAMMDSLQSPLTSDKWDTLQQRFQGHKRINNHEI